MNVPYTKKENIIEEIHGNLINDPYRWLENQNNEETKKWIDAQNKYTFSSLKNDVFKVFLDELARNFETVTFSNLFPVKGK